MILITKSEKEKETKIDNTPNDAMVERDKREAHFHNIVVCISKSHKVQRALRARITSNIRRSPQDEHEGDSRTGKENRKEQNRGGERGKTDERKARQGKEGQGKRRRGKGRLDQAGEKEKRRVMEARLEVTRKNLENEPSRGGKGSGEWGGRMRRERADQGWEPSGVETEMLLMR